MRKDPPRPRASLVRVAGVVCARLLAAADVVAMLAITAAACLTEFRPSSTVDGDEVSS